MGVDLSVYAEVRSSEEERWQVLTDETGAPEVLLCCSYGGLGRLLDQAIGPARGLPDDISKLLFQFFDQQGDLADSGFNWLSLRELELLAASEERVAWESDVDPDEARDGPGEGFQVRRIESATIAELLSDFLEPTLGALRRCGAYQSRVILEFG